MKVNLEPTRNLEFSPSNLGIAVELATNGIRLFPGFWCWMGLHTPMTFASALTLLNANTLAAMTIAVLLNPQCLHFDYIGDLFTVNLHHSNTPLMGGPNQIVFTLAAKKLADYYGMDFVANVGFSDSPENDFQSGFERGVSTIAALLCGARVLGYQGMVGANQGVSLEQLMIDSELYSYLKYIISAKVDVNDKTIQFDRIAQGGIASEFLEESKHALEHRGSYWESEVFQHSASTSPDRRENISRIREKVESILSSSYPAQPVVDGTVASRMNEIIEAYIKDKTLLASLHKDIAKAMAK
jgi:trimethylamine--corrinoid protein Co-methyltransferase